MTDNEQYKNGVEDGSTQSQLNRLAKDVEKMNSSMAILSKVGIGVLVGVGVWVGTIQTRQLRSMDDINTLTSRVENVQERQQASDIVSAEIKTRLGNIDSTLLEIKAGLRIK